MRLYTKWLSSGLMHHPSSVQVELHERRSRDHSDGPSLLAIWGYWEHKQRRTTKKDMALSLIGAFASEVWTASYIALIGMGGNQGLEELYTPINPLYTVDVC